MSMIVAICPYCRAGGVRAPSTAIGASATCPKCKSSFTVIPSDDIPPGFDKPAAPKPAPTPPPSALEPTASAAALPDVTEPSPVLPAEPRAKPTPVAVPPEPAAPPELGMVFALAALILVGPAVLVSQLPLGRYVALAVAALGFGGGLVCLGAEGKARLAAALAATLHLILLVILLFLPSWLDLDPWRGNGRPKLEPRGPFAVENVSGAPGPVSAGDWLDAGKYSWQFQDARVSALATVGPVELVGPNGAKRTTKEQYLQLMLRVRNTGFEKELSLSGWASGSGTDGVRVTDANGKPLALATFESGWTPNHGSPTGRALPGHTSEVALVFAAPPAKSELVRVQLPGAVVGVPEEIKFQVATPVGGLRGSLP